MRSIIVSVALLSLSLLSYGMSNDPPQGPVPKYSNKLSINSLFGCKQYRPNGSMPFFVPGWFSRCIAVVVVEDGNVVYGSISAQ
ncbi:MAG: hypothetical protein ACJ75B_07775 [Flavisolibacter sp.]